MKRLRYKYCTYLSRKIKIRSALLPMAELISGSKKFFNWVGDKLVEWVKDTKEVVCDNTDQFMNVLHVVRDTCPEDRLVYTEV